MTTTAKNRLSIGLLGVFKVLDFCWAKAEPSA